MSKQEIPFWSPNMSKEASSSLARGLKQAKTRNFAKNPPKLISYPITTGVKIVSNWSGASTDEVRYDNSTPYFHLARSIDKALDRKEKKMIKLAKAGIFE